MLVDMCIEPQQYRILFCHGRHFLSYVTRALRLQVSQISKMK